MEGKKIEKLSVKDLLRKQKKVNSRHELIVSEFEKAIVMELPTNIIFKDLIEFETEEFLEKLVYNYCVEPDLKNEELLKHYDCSHTPYKIVYEIFDIQTLKNIGTSMMEIWAKKSSNYAVAIVEDLKN